MEILCASTRDQSWVTDASCSTDQNTNLQTLYKQTMAPVFNLVLSVCFNLLFNLLFKLQYSWACCVCQKWMYEQSSMIARLSVSRQHRLDSVHLKTAFARNKLSCHRFGYVTLIYSTLNMWCFWALSNFGLNFLIISNSGKSQPQISKLQFWCYTVVQENWKYSDVRKRCQITIFATKISTFQVSPSRMLD